MALAERGLASPTFTAERTSWSDSTLQEQTIIGQLPSSAMKYPLKQLRNSSSLNFLQSKNTD
jgi:hypothetical protein